MTIVGTRPEIIRLSRVVAKLDEFCEHTLVHTGQNYDYELNKIFFDDLGIRSPDIFLECAGRSAAETIGEVIVKTDQLLAENPPQAVLILGDTNSAMAAIPAKRRKIPIFHMEAGNRCFDLRVPEEINRKIVDHIADVNLPYSDIAREYLLREGVRPDLIVKTGSPMFEVLHFYGEKIKSSNVLSRLSVSRQQYFVVSVHREENVDSDLKLEKFISVLNELAHRFGCPIIVSTHPRTRKRLELLNFELTPEVQLHRPCGFCDYVCLQINATAVLSDSGTITEEASILNFPALNLREAHERPEGAEEATVMMVGFDIDRVLQGLSIISAQCRGEERQFFLVNDYEAPNVSDKVVRTIQSYTDYVNRVVWRK